MPSIYLHDSLPEDEICALRKEFPHYDFRLSCEGSDWNAVEIFFGKHLREEEIYHAPRLRWVHYLGTDLSEMPLSEIKRRGNIAVTLSKGENVSQIVEFVIGSILSFAKQFFQWQKICQTPSLNLNNEIKETMWTLQKKILLQIGLGEVGTGIVKIANSLGMKTWGVRRQLTFHPYCHKTFPLENLHSLLPAADIVILTLPKNTLKETLFGAKEFHLMKRDSIFILIGSEEWIDKEALIEEIRKEKFRGVLIDAQNFSVSKNNFSEFPNVFFTPQISSSPEKDEHIAFQLFRRNLRLFVSGKINEMKNRVLL